MYEFHDAEFGFVRVRVDSRARRLIFRVEEGVMVITSPAGYSLEQVRWSVDEYRGRLRRLMARGEAVQERCRLSVGDRIPCYGGDIALVAGVVRDRFLFRYEGDSLQVLCPPGADLNDPRVRKRLAQGVCRLLYRRAQELLPRRLAQVACRVGAEPRAVSIGRGRRKLGHCTRSREIQLSFYLMFLPEPLVDYVICHELAHLQQMNHGPRFHDLCNRYCGGQELVLRKQLRAFTFLF